MSKSLKRNHNFTLAKRACQTRALERHRRIDLGFDFACLLAPARSPPSQLSRL